MRNYLKAENALLHLCLTYLLNRLPLSVCMISGAEAHRIRKSLESIAAWAAEIVVVLNEDVQDGTEAIAEEFGAKVYREPWKGHIDQKNSAADKATQPWILGLDADEVVSEPLQQEIIQTIHESGENNPYQAYEFPRLSFFQGRWIRHGDWYPDRQLRLWKRGHARWGGINPHDHLMVEGKIGRLTSNLFHFSDDSIDKTIEKIPPYSEDFLCNFIKSGKKPSVIDLGFRPFYRFFRAYFLRLGFLDGWQGYYIAWLGAFSASVRYSKTFTVHRKDCEK